MPGGVFGIDDISGAAPLSSLIETFADLPELIGLSQALLLLVGVDLTTAS